MIECRVDRARIRGKRELRPSRVDDRHRLRSTQHLGPNQLRLDVARQAHRVATREVLVRHDVEIGRTVERLRGLSHVRTSSHRHSRVGHTSLGEVPILGSDRGVADGHHLLPRGIESCLRVHASSHEELEARRDERRIALRAGGVAEIEPTARPTHVREIQQIGFVGAVIHRRDELERVGELLVRDRDHFLRSVNDVLAVEPHRAEALAQQRVRVRTVRRHPRPQRRERNVRLVVGPAFQAGENTVGLEAGHLQRRVRAVTGAALGLFVRDIRVDDLSGAPLLRREISRRTQELIAERGSGGDVVAVCALEVRHDAARQGRCGGGIVEQLGRNPAGQIDFQNVLASHGRNECKHHRGNDQRSCRTQTGAIG